MSPPRTPPVAVLDTSVLYPTWSRVLLRRLAGSQPPWFRDVWSRAIARELWRTYADRGMARGLTPEQALHQARAILYPLRQVFVLADGARRPAAAPGSPLTDPHDEHLWNAALNAGAHYIVSHNTRDFPPPTVMTHEVAGESIQVVRHVYHGVEFLTAIEFIEDVLGQDAATLYGQALPPAVVRSRRTPGP